jgi:hypothetical protein
MFHVVSAVSEFDYVLVVTETPNKRRPDSCFWQDILSFLSNRRPGALPALCRSTAFSSVSNSTANDEWLISSCKPERCEILAGDISADVGRRREGKTWASTWLRTKRYKIPAINCRPRCPNEDQMSRILLNPRTSQCNRICEDLAFKISTRLMADSLCWSEYCLCVNVYCTTATGCQPHCR